MKQWFAHEMEIQKTNLPSYFICEKVKFLCRQLSFLPLMFWAEITIEITCVCYFYIATIYHSFSLKKSTFAHSDSPFLLSFFASKHICMFKTEAKLGKNLGFTKVSLKKVVGICLLICK